MAQLLLCKPQCRAACSRAGSKANSPIPLGIHPRGVTTGRGLETTERDWEEGSEAKSCEKQQRGREHPIALGL